MHYVKKAGMLDSTYISGCLIPRSWAMSLYALHAMRMLSVPPEVTFDKTKTNRPSCLV